MVLSKKEIKLLFVGGFLSAASCMFFTEAGLSTTSVMLSILYVLLSVKASPAHKLMFVALAIPNTKALNIGGISAAICICAISVITGNIKRKNTKVAIPLFFFFIMCLHFLIEDGDISNGIIMPIKTIMNALFFYSLVNDDEINANSFFIGTKAAFALMVGIICPFITSALGLGREGRMAIVGNDPNMLAIESAFAMSCLCLAYFRSSLISQMEFITSMGVLGVVCMLCGSRMGLILFALSIVLSILFNLKKVGKSTLMVSTIWIAIVAFLGSSMGQAALENLLVRTENLSEHDNISNGRFLIWAQYFEVFNADLIRWIWGVGDYEKYGIDYMAHNGIIEDIAAVGLLGVFLLYSTYFKIFKTQYKFSSQYTLKKTTLYNAIPCIIPLVGCLTLHSLTSIMNTTMLFIGVLFLTNLSD